MNEKIAEPILRFMAVLLIAAWCLHHAWLLLEPVLVPVSIAAVVVTVWVVVLRRI